jgi:glycosyltransferase involved in cell wall biosynthesis
MSKQQFVNIAVCGKFHLLNYIAFLQKEGVINRFYFSHKRNAMDRFAIDKDNAFNFPIKEYLTQGHGRFLGHRGYEMMAPFYHLVWERSVLQHWKSCEVLHTIANGSSLGLIHRAKREGSKVIAEAINTHPQNLADIIAREEARWGCAPQPRPAKRIERTLAEVREADALLVPSQIVADTFKLQGVDKEIFKIPYAANLKRFSFDTAAFDARRANTGPLRVICVGAIGLRKGQLYLLEAVRRLGIERISLTLVGVVSPQVAPILSQFRQYFTHIERVPGDEMQALLSRHDVFVLPSLEEGLAVSQCEALACGLAVITTREAGGEEIINDSDTGFLIEAASVEALTERFELLCQERDIVYQTGFKAQESVKNYVNWERYADKLRQLYYSLA